MPNPDAAATHYIRRHEAATHALDRDLTDASDPEIGYVGEWHTHPMPSEPSPTDKNSIAAAHGTDAHIAIIVLAWNPATATSTTHAAMARRHPTRENYVVLTPAHCLQMEGTD